MMSSFSAGFPTNAWQVAWKNLNETRGIILLEAVNVPGLAVIL